MSGALITAIKRSWQHASLSPATFMTARLSPGLRWMLLLTLLACVAVALEEPARSSASAALKPASSIDQPGAAKQAGGVAVAAGTERWPTLPIAGNANDAAQVLPAWPALTAQSMLAWTPPPPPPPPPPLARVQGVLPAGPPPAPAFPYRMIGRMDIDGSPHAVLSNGKDSFEVAPTRVLDGNWRVEDLNDTGMQMTWLPSGQKISVGFAR
jgi:hypothetical protein